MKPRGRGDALWGLGDGSLFLLDSRCGLGLEKPQEHAVRLIATGPPSNRGAAGERVRAARPRVTVEGQVGARAAAEP